MRSEADAIYEKVLAVIVDVFGVSRGSITPDTELDELVFEEEAGGRRGGVDLESDSVDHLLARMNDVFGVTEELIFGPPMSSRDQRLLENLRFLGGLRDVWSDIYKKEYCARTMTTTVGSVAQSIRQGHYVSAKVEQPFLMPRVSRMRTLLGSAFLGSLAFGLFPYVLHKMSICRPAEVNCPDAICHFIPDMGFSVAFLSVAATVIALSYLHFRSATRAIRHNLPQRSSK